MECRSELEFEILDDGRLQGNPNAMNDLRPADMLLVMSRTTPSPTQRIADRVDMNFARHRAVLTPRG